MARTDRRELPRSTYAKEDTAWRRWSNHENRSRARRVLREGRYDAADVRRRGTEGWLTY